MRPSTKFVIAIFAATALIPVTVMAEVHDSKNQGYLIDTEGGSIIMSGTGLCWRDSDWTPARSVEPCNPTNKPVAADVPAPNPVADASVPPATELVKALPQRLSFSGDALFAFDKSVLKPEGKAMLDGLVRQLDGASYRTILATGHTDRFGSDRYNQKLSERRAGAVKDYLVSKNVPSGRIDAEGTGKAEPTTKPGDCLGAKSAKVIACLQPDRRVDVELKGAAIVSGAL